MARIKLKADSSSPGLDTTRRIVLLAACFVIFAVFVVPIVIALLIFTIRYNFLDFTENLLGFLMRSPLEWWPYLIALGHKPPIFLVLLAYVAAYLVFSVYVISAPQKALSKKALFGPAAVKTHEKDSAEVDMDEHVLMNNTRIWNPENESYPHENGGVVYGYSKRYKHYYISSGDDHRIIIGIPKSGKTRGILLPSMRIMGEAGDSIVCLDPKGELFSKTHRFYEKKGYDVKLIDLRNPARSNGWNPLSELVEVYSENIKEARKFALLAKEAKEKGLHSNELNGIEKDTFEWYAEEIKTHLAIADESAEDLAKDIAEIFVPMQPGASPADFWNNSARGLICALIILVATYDRDEIEKYWKRQLNTAGTYVRKKILEKLEALPSRIEKEQRSLASVQELINTQGQSFVTYRDKIRKREVPMDTLFDVLPDNHPAKRAYAQAKNAEDALSGMISTAQEKLDQVLSKSFLSSSYESEFTMKDIIEKKMAVFLVLPDERPARGAPAVMFITLLYQALVKIADKNGGSLPNTVQIIGEEFGALARPVPRASNMLAVSRQRKIIFTLVIQDYEQLDINYGEKEATAIKTNCNTTIFIKTNDEKTAEVISKRIGSYTYIEESRSYSRKPFSFFETSKGDSYKKAERNWLTPAEVMKWNPKFGSIVFRSFPDEETRGLKNILYGRDLVNPAIFPFLDLSKTPTEETLGLGTKEHDQELWKEDSEIDRRHTRKHVNPWRGLRPDMDNEASYYAPGAISPQAAWMIEDLDEKEISGQEEKPSGESAPKTESQKAFKEEKTEVRDFSEIGKLRAIQEEAMKAYLKEEISKARAQAKEICRIGGVLYEQTNFESIHQEYLVAQKRRIKQEILKNSDWQWAPEEKRANKALPEKRDTKAIKGQQSMKRTRGKPGQGIDIKTEPKALESALSKTGSYTEDPKEDTSKDEYEQSNTSSDTQNGLPVLDKNLFKVS